MADQITTTTFSDDAPKTNPWEQDRLGYRPFAARLAATILGMDAPNGYVIGLHGAWGSGKSTVLAFVQAFIKKHNDELADGLKPLIVVDFRPWMVSGHQDLVSAFFKVLAEAFTPVATAKRRKTWKRLLGLGRLGAAPIVDAAAALALTAHPLGATVIKGGAEATKATTNAAIDRWLAEPSLQAAYDDLKTRLAKDDVRILVLVDDIDRLDKSEIKSTMQMVKTVGRLPNVVYLLAYDREIVWSALDETAETAAGRPGYAEKIVQHELELPRPSSSGLLELFESEIGFLPLLDTDSSRTQLMIVHGVRRWIRSPRDVSRLSNALKFAWPALAGEIDPIDLLCMEGLRLFDQPTFAWIRDNRDFLLGKSAMRYITKEQRLALTKTMRDGLPSATRDDQIEMLCQLFQNQAASIGGRDRFGLEPWHETVSRRGIAYESAYDAYFSLYPPEGAVRKATVDAAIASLSDEARQLAILQGLLGDGKKAAHLVGDYLMEIEYRFLGRGAATPTAALLHALSAVSEDIQRLRPDRGFPFFEPAQQLSTLVATMVEAWGRERAGPILAQVFERSGSPAFCADIYNGRARELGVQPSQGGRVAQTLTPQAFDELGRMLLIKIERAAADGSLGDAPFYYDIVRAWSHLAGPAAPKAWLAHGMMESARFLAKTATSLLGYSMTATGRSYSLHEKRVDSFYDVATLIAACERHVEADCLTTDERARIEALKKGLADFASTSQADAEGRDANEGGDRL